MAGGKGKWWQGLDPRRLYGIPIKYDCLVNDGNKFAIEDIAYRHRGIFGNHLAYAKWYATQWAMRIKDVVDNYDTDFIYIDGNSTQPFSGDNSGSGYKADAAARIIAYYYNQAIVRQGNYFDKMCIVKFRPAMNGVATTFEGTYPDSIKTDQMWMGDLAVDDWFYRPGFYYDAGMVVHALLEYVCRDGNLTLCVSLTPGGAMDKGSARMLKAKGAWMKINGEGIYGSHAWKKFGEGEKVTDPEDPATTAKMRVFPRDKLSKKHAVFKFSTKDFRFTLGKDGSIYAFCMTVPEPGEMLTIKMLGKDAGLPDKPIKSVILLGNKQPVKWKNMRDGLIIYCPQKMPFKYEVCFKIKN